MYNIKSEQKYITKFSTSCFYDFDIKVYSTYKVHLFLWFRFTKLTRFSMIRNYHLLEIIFSRKFLRKNITKAWHEKRLQDDEHAHKRKRKGITARFGVWEPKLVTPENYWFLHNVIPARDALDTIEINFDELPSPVTSMKQQVRNFLYRWIFLKLYFFTFC